jgi:beta-galactosidase GanA
VIVLRKQTITSTLTCPLFPSLDSFSFFSTAARPPLPTKFARFNQLRSAEAVKVFVAYALSAAVLHVAYVWAAGWVSREAKLGVFFFHEGCVSPLSTPRFLPRHGKILMSVGETHRRDAWQVNERRILLGIFHAFLAAAATVSHVVYDRSQIHFDDHSSVRPSSFLPLPSIG